MSETQSQTPSEGGQQTTEPTTTTQTTEPSQTQTQASEPSLLNADDKSTEGTKPEGAPEAYADFKTPDGFKFEPEALAAAQKLFKDQNLSQTGAQALVDFYTAQIKSISEAADKAADDMVKDWGAKAKADPEIGAKLPKVKENISRMYDALINADPTTAPATRELVAEFKQAMDFTGVGNHPAFIKVFNRLAERMIEPGHVAGKGPVSPNANGAPGGGNPGLAQSMYPTKT